MHPAHTMSIGMGLAFVDLMVLMYEGRGGRFVEDVTGDDGATEHADRGSGRGRLEPALELVRAGRRRRGRGVLCGDAQQVNPGTQVQINPLTRSTQVPAFWHGTDTQSSMFVWQYKPLNPAAQVQVNELRKSTHVPPF